MRSLPIVVLDKSEFTGDKLIIGKFCAIAKGVEFIMNGANHRMNSISTYPFNIMGNGWEKSTPTLDELPLKGDTVVGNDVWIGQNVTVMPGVHIGDGSIICAYSVVASDVPPYCVAVGNPCKVIKKRFEKIKKIIVDRGILVGSSLHQKFDAGIFFAAC